MVIDRYIGEISFEGSVWSVIPLSLFDFIFKQWQMCFYSKLPNNGTLPGGGGVDDVYFAPLWRISLSYL